MEKRVSNVENKKGKVVSYTNRLAIVENQMAEFSNHCQILSNVSRGVSIKLSDIKVKLEGQDTALESAGVQIVNDVNRTIEEKLDMSSNRIFDDEQKSIRKIETSHKAKCEEVQLQMKELVTRVDVIENSVISLHDDSIQTLEFILQSRRHQ